jgi:hypothetical protein
MTDGDRYEVKGYIYGHRTRALLTRYWGFDMLGKARVRGRTIQLFKKEKGSAGDLHKIVELFQKCRRFLNC